MIPPHTSLSTLVDNHTCLFCGSKLSSGKLSKCLNVQCNSHDFVVGNRVILLNQPDYGTGFIEKISDYKTPYEYCSDSNEEEPDLKTQTNSNTPFYYEKLMYHVRFRVYNDRVTSAEEIQHEIFYEDEIIRTISGLGTIKKVNINRKKPIVTYDVDLQDGSTRNFAENEIIEKAYSPIESVLHNSYSNSSIFTLRYFARLLYNAYTSSNIKFISNSRLTLLPHQVYIAHQLIMEYLPRYILADEVGLGKTIEAGIFVKEMISRNLAKKILIIAPANLVNQWIWEFESKFSIKLERFDSQFVKKLGNDAAHADDQDFPIHLVNTLVEFTKNILEYVYLLPERLERMSNRLENQSAATTTENEATDTTSS